MAEPSRRAAAAADRRRAPWGLLGLLGLLGGGAWWLLRDREGSTPASGVEEEIEGETDTDTDTGGRKPKFAGGHQPGEAPPRPPKFAGGVDFGDGRQPDLDQLITDYPQGRTLYQVVDGDRFGGADRHGIAHRYLLSEGYLAAREEGGLSHEEALAWAPNASSKANRIAVIDLIQCSGWNDAMYGANPRKGTRTSPNGHSILLWPQHSPVLEALTQKERPTRAIKLSGNGVRSDWRRYELLWLGTIDRAALWADRKVVSKGEWPDGQSMENPPAWIMDLGIADESGALTAGEWGCPDSPGGILVEDE